MENLTEKQVKAYEIGMQTFLVEGIKPFAHCEKAMALIKGMGIGQATNKVIEAYAAGQAFAFNRSARLLMK